MPRVFISYSHDSDSHKERVLALAVRLRGDGIDVVIDQDKMPGGPDEGWPLWSERQVLTAERVLIACTPSYCERYEGTTPPGVGLGVACEARIIRQEIYRAKGETPKYRPIVFDGWIEEHLPASLQGYHRFEAHKEAGYQELRAWLNGSIAAAASPTPVSTPAWPAPNSGLRPILADRKDEFDIFERMITGQSRKRILLLHGASNCGKTTLSGELCKYAERLGLATGVADIKGCRTQESTLKVLRLRLGGQFDGAASLDDLLDGLTRANRPILLALDTFEDASEEIQQWTERCLGLLDAMPFVVAMISGRQVPEAGKSRWCQMAHLRHLSAIEDVSDWMWFANQRWPGCAIDEKDLQVLVRATRGDPGYMGALLPNLVSGASRGTAGGAS